MKNLIVAAAVLFCITGCRKEVSREKIGPTVTSQGVIDCSHFDYCYTCMPGAGSGCGFKASAFCPGHQSATIHSTTYLSHYDDGSSEQYTSETYTDVGECH